MRPGVLECGCLWDGRVLYIENGCEHAVDDHGLGRPPATRRRPGLNLHDTDCVVVVLGDEWTLPSG